MATQKISVDPNLLLTTRRHFGHKLVRVKASLRSLDAMTHKMVQNRIIVWG